MAASLIPVAPCVGGNSEFVLQSYHYRTLEEAATLIEDALMLRPVDNQFRTRLSNLTLRFSIENHKYFQLITFCGIIIITKTIKP
jgi:hypothetical protein